MGQWKPIITSNLVIGGGGEGTSRELTVQCENLGAGDTLKVAGRVPGAVAYGVIALIKKATNAVIPGATGIVADADNFLVDVTGLEIQLQYTKATNNPIINWSDTPT